MFLFMKYWDKMKNNLQQLLGIKNDLEAKIREVTALVKVAMDAGDEDTAIKFRRQRAKLFAMRPTAKEVSGKVKKFGATWQDAASKEEGSGVGILVTLALGTAAIGAAGYVAIKGMQLLKDFKRESSIIAQLKAKTLTIAQAQGLIKSSAAFDPVNFKVGTGIGIGMIGTIVIALGLGIFMMRRV